jgi:hypothetical protein
MSLLALLEQHNLAHLLPDLATKSPSALSELDAVDLGDLGIRDRKQRAELLAALHAYAASQTHAAPPPVAEPLAGLAETLPSFLSHALHGYLHETNPVLKLW